MIAQITQLGSRVPTACQRRLARWLGRRILHVRPDRPLISFTFDDFPSTAYVTGGRILEAHDALGTYYVALGLRGQTTATGPQFGAEEIQKLLKAGHELGCHTFNHCPAWETKPAEYERSILQNAAELERHIPFARFRTHSYPINHPRPHTKRLAARYFACCRAGGQTFNYGATDLNHLSAFFIEQSRDNLDAIKAVIDATVERRGWLVFATHDVCPAPTRFGCTPELFEEVVRYAAASTATLLPVDQALVAVKSATRRTLALA